MKKQYKYFTWYTSEQDGNNTNELNKLLEEGWIPIRETTPSNPHGSVAMEQSVTYGDIRLKYSYRYLLILLSKD